MSETVTLYHGSELGIRGAIRPDMGSRRCDFGQGFYLGTDRDQTSMLACSGRSPHFYEFELELEDLRSYEFEPDFDWALMVAHSRGYVPSRHDSQVGDYLRGLAGDVDFLVGPIADDRLFQTLGRFFEGEITDTALVACLNVMRLGTQYVLRTQTACDRLRMVSDDVPTQAEASRYASLANRMRASAGTATRLAQRQHRNDGRYFDEALRQMFPSSGGSSEQPGLSEAEARARRADTCHDSSVGEFYHSYRGGGDGAR